MFNNNNKPNIFGGGGTQQTNNIFGGGNQQPNNIFGGNNNANTNQNNGFGANKRTNEVNSANIFGQNQQQNQPTQGGNIFGQNNNQNNQSPFQNNQNQGGIFNNQNQNQNTNQGIFNQNNNQQQGNIFNQNNQNNMNNQNNNLFNQGNQQGNIFNQNNNNQGNQGMFNQNNNNNYNQPIVGGGFNSIGSPFPQSLHNVNLSAMTPEQQSQILAYFSPDYIRQLITLCQKQLDTKRLQSFNLSYDNTLRNEKASKIAQTYNIKNQLILVKKEIRDKVTNPIKKLKENNDKLQSLSNEFSIKVFEKLQLYKERLVLAITQSKMINEVKSEVEELETQIKDFLKPLFNAHQNRTSFSFIDPDPFCINISQRLLKNITNLDNKMDELLACEGEVSQEIIDTGLVIQQLVEYYQNVAAILKEFSERYNKEKRLALARNRVGNTEQTLRKISEKANTIVNKQLQCYEFLKQIQTLLQKREKKLSSNYEY